MPFNSRPIVGKESKCFGQPSEWLHTNPPYPYQARICFPTEPRDVQNYAYIYYPTTSQLVSKQGDDGGLHGIGRC